MTYEAKTLRRQKVRYNSLNEDNPLIHQFVHEGAKITPTAASACITIYSPQGTVVIEAHDMTIDGTLLSYDLDTTYTSTFPVGHGYRADIQIESSSKTYKEHVVFDIVKYVLNIGVTKDTLIARDSSVKGSEHAGFENLFPFIEACRDELQLKLESKARQDKRVWEEMIIDSSRISIPARAYILWQYHADLDPDGGKAAHHMGQYHSLWGSFKNAVRYSDGDGIEKTTLSPPKTQRLMI